MNKIIKANINKYHKAKAEFESMFGIPLKEFMEISTLEGQVLGFDIVGFDYWLQVPEGVSTKDFVNKKYGKEAVKIIKGLL